MTGPLNVDQVAEQLGCEPEQVRVLARRGELVGFKNGRQTSPWRFRQSQVDAYIARREALASRGGRRTA